MRTIFALSALAAALCPTPVLADWGKTHWGDSVEQVVATVGEGAHAERGGPDDKVFDQDLGALKIGDYHGVPARLEFFFDAKGGLSIVKIRPQDDTQCEPFVAAVLAELDKLDAPELKAMDRISIATWRQSDQANNLAVLVSEVTTTGSDRRLCHLIYQHFGSGRAGLHN